MFGRWQRRSATKVGRDLASAVTLVELLVVLALIGVLVALLFPAIQTARSSARQVTCQNNLAQLCLALHQHHDVHKSLPHALVDREWISASGEWSWGARVLPYLEQAPMYEQIHFELWPAEEENQAILGAALPLFRCPAESADRHQACEAWDGYAWAEVNITNDNYGMSEEIDMINDRLREGWRFASITDGLSHTLLLGETTSFNTMTDEETPWGWHTTWSSVLTAQMGEATHDFWTTVDATAIDSPSRQGWNHLCSHHASGAYAAACDGSARLLPFDIDPSLLQQLAKPNDGEPVVHP